MYSRKSKQQGSADPFYSSRQWKEARYRALARASYRCEHCSKDLKGKGNSRVDHIETRKARPDLSLEPSNLRALCPSCDNKRHIEKGDTNRRSGTNPRGGIGDPKTIPTLGGPRSTENFQGREERQPSPTSAEGMAARLRAQWAAKKPPSI